MTTLALSPGQTTCSVVKAFVRENTDSINNPAISDTYLNSLVTTYHEELRGILIQQYDDEYFVAVPWITVTSAGKDVYPLPPDFFKSLGSDWVQTPTAGMATSWSFTLRKFNFRDRNKWQFPIMPTILGVAGANYRLRNNAIWFRPPPNAGQYFLLWYIPRLVPANDSTALALNGAKIGDTFSLYYNAPFPWKANTYYDLGTTISVTFTVGLVTYQNYWTVFIPGQTGATIPSILSSASPPSTQTQIQDGNMVWTFTQQVTGTPGVTTFVGVGAANANGLSMGRISSYTTGQIETQVTGTPPTADGYATNYWLATTTGSTGASNVAALWGDHPTPAQMVTDTGITWQFSAQVLAGQVPFVIGATDADTAVNLAAAIMASGLNAQPNPIFAQTNGSARVFISWTDITLPIEALFVAGQASVIPLPALVSNVIDGVNGWEKYIVDKCCVDVLVRQEKDPSAAMQAAAGQLQRLNSETANRDMEPATTVDVFSSNDGYGGGGYCG